MNRLLPLGKAHDWIFSLRIIKKEEERLPVISMDNTVPWLFLLNLMSWKCWLWSSFLLDQSLVLTTLNRAIHNFKIYYWFFLVPGTSAIIFLKISNPLLHRLSSPGTIHEWEARNHEHTCSVPKFVNYLIRSITPPIFMVGWTVQSRANLLLKKKEVFPYATKGSWILGCPSQIKLVA